MIGGNAMVSQELIFKLNCLPESDYKAIEGMINSRFFALKPSDVLKLARAEGLENPMTEKEIDDFINKARKGEI